MNRNIVHPDVKNYDIAIFKLNPYMGSLEVCIFIYSLFKNGEKFKKVVFSNVAHGMVNQMDITDCRHDIYKLIQLMHDRSEQKRLRACLRLNFKVRNDDMSIITYLDSNNINNPTFTLLTKEEVINDLVDKLKNELKKEPIDNFN